MMNPRGDESRGDQSPPEGHNFIYKKGFLTPDLKPPEYVQPLHQRNTVKELLMRRRQRRSPLQDDDDGGTERRFKSSKLEASLSHASPRPSEPPASAYCVGSAPTADVRLTLFHWQITQEEQRVGGAAPELLSMQDADGDTCLHIAVAQGKRALAYVLAAKMALSGSLEIKERNGQTALHLAAATDQHTIVWDLLSHGAQVDAQDLWGRSPLHVCAKKGHALSLQSIWNAVTSRRRHADLEMFNYDGLTPLHTAVLSHNAVVRELRTKENAGLSVTMELVQRKHMYVECVKILLLMGASFGTKDQKSGRTCLHMAAEEANVELLAMFLSQPSSLSIVNAKMFSGNTALHIVSSLRDHPTQMESVRQLLGHGADPGTRNLENELPSQLVPEGPDGGKVKQILKGKHCHA